MRCLLFAFCLAACDPGTDGGDGGVDMSGPAGFLSHDMQIIVEPGDNAASLITAIGAAKTSVHMVMYQLTSSSITNALTTAKRAGRSVQVLLNAQFPSGGNANLTAYTTLMTAGVSVKWAPTRFTYTHEKTVILDGTTAYIMTMNATQSSPTSNREYIAIDTHADDVAEAEALFQADWANQMITPSGNLAVAPDNAVERIGDVVEAAKQTLDLEVEELSDSRFVVLLGQKAQAGVRVRVVVPSSTSTTWSAAMTSAISQLKSAGVSFSGVSTPYIHAKAIVADGMIAYVGSENLTAGSLDNNRELGVCFDGAGVSTVADTVAADFAAGTPQ
jgi:phosphatidylserine/phosphatidylglycerophosphate/cardiolipin synthase-like enzyme